MKPILPPAAGVVVFKSDVIVLTGIKGCGKALRGKKGNRKVCMEYSRKVSAALAFLAMNAPCTWESMITLTYGRDIPPGRECKKHLKRFLDMWRIHHPDGFYLWWCEFQKRGAPHFHMLVDRWIGDVQRVLRVDKDGHKIWTCDREWTGIWEQWERSICDYRHAKMGRHSVAWESLVHRDGRYACREASKRVQKTLPDGWESIGRWYGSNYEAKPIPVRFVNAGPGEVYDWVGPKALRLVDRMWKHLHGAADKIPQTPF